LDTDYININASSANVDQQVDTAGWYVIYSSVQWSSCQTSWYHRVYSDGVLITDISGTNSSNGCRSSSHLVVTSFVNGTVAAKASDSDRSLMRIRIALQRIG